MAISDEIRKAVGTKELIIGRDSVLKGLRAKEIKKIVIATNCEERLRDTVKQYTKIAGIEVVEAEMTNKDLGVLCKKPFLVSLLALK